MTHFNTWDFIETNILTKFHEYQTENQAARVYNQVS